MRTQILLLVLAVAAFATETSKPANFEVFKTNLLSLKSKYAVDTVVQLLQALHGVQVDHLSQLDQDWIITSQNFETSISTANSLVTSQTTECQSIDNGNDASAKERELYVTYIKNAQESIKTNNEGLAQKELTRCQANLIFMDRLKDNQDTLALLKYLRQRISDPSFKDYLAAQPTALIEMKKANKNNIFSFIAKHHLKILTQQYQGEDNLGYDQNARTEEEIGKGHIDNDKGALSLDHAHHSESQDADTMVAQLVALLDELIASINKDMDNLRDAELASVEDFIHYKAQIQRENAINQKFITKWSQRVQELDGNVANNAQASQECHEREHTLAENAQSIVVQYQEATTAYHTKRTSIVHTITDIEEVIKLYIEKVASANSEYKHRVDDWLDNQHFDESAGNVAGNEGAGPEAEHEGGKGGKSDGGDE